MSPQKNKPTVDRTWDNMMFVNRELSVDEQAECKAMKNTWDTIDLPLQNFLEDGHSIKITWEERNNCFAVFASTSKLGHRHWQLILPGRGSTPLKAVKQLLYKHHT